MRTHTQRLAWLLIVGGILVGLVSCAGLTVKQKVSNYHQGIHQTLKTLDALEVSWCQPDPKALNHCTASPAILTNQQHQRLSAAFADAYDMDAKIGLAIIVWCPKTPAMACANQPPEVKSLYADAVNILAILNTLAPTQKVRDAIAVAQDILDAITQIATTFQPK